MVARVSTMLALWLLAGCSRLATSEPVVQSGPLARLTHLQWENTVVDLLSLPEPTGLSESFVPDQAVSTFDNDPAGLVVTPTLWQQYQAAAEELALQVVSDPELYRLQVKKNTERDAWIAELGRRVYRRDLSPAEHSDHVALFHHGRQLFGTDDPFADGVRASIAGFLQSPHFLYRTGGAGTEADPEQLAPDQLASKLSYGLWNTLPDEDLMAAAGAGLEPDALADEAQRMLADPRARATVADLHRQLLHIDNYQTIYRTDEEVFEDYALSLPAAMEQEVYAVVDDVVFGSGTLRDLLTTRRTFVDSRLADVYRVTGVKGTTFVAVDLDPSERSGLLTLTGFLALHADRLQPNLIGRGGFVSSRLLCVDLPTPPPGATTTPTGEGNSLRARIEDQTGECGGACHADLLNPLGFAMGRYDEKGAWDAFDRARPIDATGTYTFASGERSFDGAIELAAILADEEQVHRCYASHLLAYFEQRAVTAADDARLDELAAASLSGRPIHDLIVDIVTDEAFRARGP